MSKYSGHNGAAERLAGDVEAHRYLQLHRRARERLTKRFTPAFTGYRRAIEPEWSMISVWTATTTPRRRERRRTAGAVASEALRVVPPAVMLIWFLPPPTRRRPRRR